jgi:hypothetical protein
MAIDFNARYFTKRKDAPHESNRPFLEGVDPQGVLEKLRKHDVIHGPDNQVEYIKLLENDGYAKIIFPRRWTYNDDTLIDTAKLVRAHSKSEISWRSH